MLAMVNKDRWRLVWPLRCKLLCAISETENTRRNGADERYERIADKREFYNILLFLYYIVIE